MSGRTTPRHTHAGQPLPDAGRGENDTDTTVRVLIVDDHVVVRQGIQALLATEPDIVVVGEAENGREAVVQSDRLQPDVVRRVLTSVQQDLATLSKPQMIERLPDADRAKAKELRDSVAARLGSISDRLADPSR